MAKVDEEEENLTDILESGTAMGIVSLMFVIIGMVDSHTIWGNETGWGLGFFVLLIHTYFANRRANRNYSTWGTTMYWISKNIDDKKQKEFGRFFHAFYFAIGLESRDVNVREVIKNTPEIITNYIDENAWQMPSFFDDYDNPDFLIFDDIMDLVRVSKENE